MASAEGSNTEAVGGLLVPVPVPAPAPTTPFGVGTGIESGLASPNELSMALECTVLGRLWVRRTDGLWTVWS